MPTKTRAKLTEELELLQKQVYSLRQGYQSMTLRLADIMSRLSAGLSGNATGDYSDGKIFPILKSAFDPVRLYLDTSETELILNTSDGIPFIEVALKSDFMDRIPSHA